MRDSYQINFDKLDFLSHNSIQEYPKCTINHILQFHPIKIIPFTCIHISCFHMHSASWLFCEDLSFNIPVENNVTMYIYVVTFRMKKCRFIKMAIYYWFAKVVRCWKLFSNSAASKSSSFNVSPLFFFFCIHNLLK